MPANRIRYLGAVGLLVAVGLAAAAGAASAPATGTRLAADSAQASSKIAFISATSQDALDTNNHSSLHVRTPTGPGSGG
jgi:hypothetical protein